MDLNVSGRCGSQRRSGLFSNDTDHSAACEGFCGDFVVLSGSFCGDFSTCSILIFEVLVV